MAAELLYSGPTIDEEFEAASREVAALTERDITLHMTALTGFAGKEALPIHSYLCQLRSYVGALGICGEVNYDERRGLSAAEAIDALQEKDGLPGGTIVMAPWPKDDKDGSLLESILEHLAPIHNIDGMTAEGREHHFPATPLSADALVWRGLQAIGIEDIREARLVTVGNGRTVMAPYKQLLLSKYGMLPTVEINTKEEAKEMLPHLHEIADVVVTATGSSGQITEEHLAGPDPHEGQAIVAIDCGVGERKDPDDPKFGDVYGDVNPSVYYYTGPARILVTPAPVRENKQRLDYGGVGVGPGTVAKLAKNGINAAWAIDLSSMSRA